MALYIPPARRRRRLIAAAALALVAGLAAGVLIGRASTPSVADRVRAVQSDARAAAAGHVLPVVHPLQFTAQLVPLFSFEALAARIIRFHLGTRFIDNELRDSQISRIASSSYLQEPRLAGLPLSCGMAVNPRGRVTARGTSFAFTMR